MTHLLLTVRFLDDRYHGLLDRGGPPEWPPSPFRLFQALVAGLGRRGELDTSIGQSLGRLQKLPPPLIIAPRAKSGQAITRFVPNNDGDVPAKFDRQTRLTAKHTQPTLFLLEPDQKPEVHYIWPLEGVNGFQWQDLDRAARSLTTLGWGIDMAFASARLAAEAELQAIKGVRWYPKERDYPFAETLRVPTYDTASGECTLCDLRHCYETFVNRIEHGKPLKTVDKPKVFDRVLYTSIERQPQRPTFFFRLLDASGEPTRYPHAALAHIAAAVRHAAIGMMEGNGDAAWLNRFVRGKNEPQRDDHQQISYVPLPSIGHEHADAMIRNVMLVAPIGCEVQLKFVADRLDGAPLRFKGDGDEPNDVETLPRATLPALIERFNPPEGKFIRTHYLGRSKVWQSVTPVVLDEHAKRVDRPNKETGKTEKGWNHDELICKALRRAGIETPCEFTWQTIPFYKNCLTAHRNKPGRLQWGYLLPKRLDGKTAVHLRLTFDHEIPGPLTLGAGRHCGFGLMAAVAD
jgi:CRISPR-associated protein Csb2